MAGVKYSKTNWTPTETVVATYGFESSTDGFGLTIGTGGSFVRQTSQVRTGTGAGRITSTTSAVYGRGPNIVSTPGYMYRAGFYHRRQAGAGRGGLYLSFTGSTTYTNFIPPTGEWGPETTPASSLASWSPTSTQVAVTFGTGADAIIDWDDISVYRFNHDGWVLGSSTTPVGTGDFTTEVGTSTAWALGGNGQADTSIQRTMTGLTVGKPYRAQFTLFCYNWTLGNEIKVETVGLGSSTVPAIVGGTSDYFYDFVATATSHIIKLTIVRGEAVTSTYTLLRSAKLLEYTPPTAPTPTVRTSFDVSSSADLTWTFNDPDPGDTQSAYQVIIERVSDSAQVLDTGKRSADSNLGVGTYTIAANTLTEDTQYRWRVRTWDADDLVGPYSSNSTFTTLFNNDPPSATTNPVALFDPALSKAVTWTYNGNDASDPQKRYRVQVSTVSPVSSAYDSGWVTSATASHTIPAGTLTANTQYTWFVTVEDTRGPFTGSSTPTNLPVNYNPTAPVLSEKSEIVAGNSNTFNWTFTDPNPGDTQSAYQFLIERISDGVTVVDTGKVTSTVQSRTVNAGTLVKGTQYRWSVYTWDQFGYISPLATWDEFQTATDIAVTITAPVSGTNIDVATQNVTWTTFAPDGSTQAKRRVRLIRLDTGAVVTDTTMQTNTTKSYGLSGLISGVNYRIEVSVVSSAGVTSDVVSTILNVEYTKPNVPTINVYNIGATVGVGVVNPTPTGLRPSVSSNTIMRRTTTTEWAVRGTIGPNETFVDFLVAAETQYIYKVVANS